MKYDVVLWDADGTLLDPLPAERSAVRKALSVLGLGDCSEEELDRYHTINWKWWTLAEEGKEKKDEIVWKRFEEFLETIGKDGAKAREMNGIYMESLGDGFQYNPGGFEILSLFKGRVKQYVVTNGYRRSQVNKIEKSGICGMVDGVFISEDIGYDKPRKEFFDAVLHAIGDPQRERVLLVGDSLLTDMPGGIEAGIDTCLYDRTGRKFGSGLAIDYEIDDLVALSSIVGVKG